MRETRLLMDMPITVEVIDLAATAKTIQNIFDYFIYIDETFSTFKDTSEITRINKGILKGDDYSADMKTVFALSEETNRATNGFFDIKAPNGSYDPSGMVKGWAINNAANILLQQGFENFYIEAGGDIQTHGRNSRGHLWNIGIRNPFHQDTIVKIIFSDNKGVATSGTYIRGQHIYNPHTRRALITDIVSLTVIGPNIYEADRFATAAFAMGEQGIAFIEQLSGFEAYMINTKGTATKTSGFDYYTKEYA